MLLPLNFYDSVVLLLLQHLVHIADTNSSDIDYKQGTKRSWSLSISKKYAAHRISEL